MATPFRVKAVYEYTSPHEDDLNFPIGQIITVNEQEDDDWYGGEYVDDAGTKHEGIFPRNFVEKFEPTAPPRPTRTRTKKEPEPEAEVPQPVEKNEPPLASPPVRSPVAEAQHAAQHDSEPEIEAAEEPVLKSPVAAAPPPFPSRGPAQPAESQDPVSAPSAPKPFEQPAPAPVPVAATSSQAPKPKPTGPPPVAEKPSSFKDRIAAFNKPAAPPVAPFKPGGGAAPAFVKKPFVAAPPSRNAYVPPPREAPTTKVYRREEDPEVKEAEAQVQEQAERAGFTSPENHNEDEEDQPKPTSLKERIALLQKQQAEQAARHADPAPKKEKPKKPVKKPSEPVPTAEEEAEDEAPAPLERKYTTDSLPSRTSMDDAHATRAPPTRRKSSTRPIPEGPHDGNEADMSGAGDTTEGQDDGTEREESDEVSRTVSRAPTGNLAPQVESPKQTEEAEDEEEEEEEDEDDVDPEVRRKEELRARMAKMSGGMGFHGMFGAPMPAAGSAPPKKKKSKPEPTAEDEDEQDAAPRAAPPVPTAMALPGMGGPRKSLDEQPEDDVQPASRAPPPAPPRQKQEPVVEEDDDEEDNDLTPAPTSTLPIIPPRDSTGPPPPVPGGRPAPPPVPSDSRPAAPAAGSPSEGSESDDEMSGAALDKPSEITATESIKSPPPPMPQSPDAGPRSPPLSPRFEAPPTSIANKRSSRPPPPIPGAVAPPVPTQTRPPPPPPPGGLSRQGTSDLSAPQLSRPPQAGEEHEDEATEYEGDYDTDIASSVPHKDALKSHARDSSFEDNTLQSPVTDAPPPSFPPPVPSAAPPSRAAPPPIPTQPAPENKRRSVDVPRAAPPPPPVVPAKEPSQDEEYDPFNYASPSGGPPSAYAHKTPRIEEEAYFPSVQSPGTRAPPPPPSAPTGRNRQSMDVPRTSMAGKRSGEMPRPSMAMESGFIANEIDLGLQSGWWKQSNQVPPALQGRRDIFFESQESTTNNRGEKTVVSKTVTVLFQDYSQTIITVQYDPYDPSDVELDQSHEPPPRSLRQDQMEEYYERFGRHISEQVSAKKDSVVGDGTPQGLIYELLKPYRDVLLPVGTRAYGALVYSNMANASTQQHDVIRAGDIISIRNAKFQGKHGPMHAKYSVEVGKPDHVAVVAEWDGTKKKVRAWEQGRESKKVKQESFKLDDLRSGEVKIWRVMPRSWIGWPSQP
ncbi:hypothetical protein CC79DRAFT_921251 [Sarocladium strictum]